MTSLALFVGTNVFAQTVIYDIPALGGNVFPGQDGRLTLDDARVAGSGNIAETITIPVAAVGQGNADVTAFIYRDSGSAPASNDLLWQATYPSQAFSSPAGGGDLQLFTWNNINTPIPNDIFWGIRFSNVDPGIQAIGARQGDVSAISVGGPTDSEVLYVQPSGNQNGLFTQYDFYVNEVDVEDNLAVNITSSTLGAVPEPRVLGLLLFGGMAIQLLRRRNRNA